MLKQLFMDRPAETARGILVPHASVWVLVSPPLPFLLPADVQPGRQQMMGQALKSLSPTVLGVSDVLLDFQPHPSCGGHLGE